MEYAIAVPFIAGLIQSLKMAFLPSKFAPLVAVILGVAYSVFTNTSFSAEAVVWGAILGLSASGLYDAGKIGVGEIKKRM